MTRTVAGLQFAYKIMVDLVGHAMTDLCERCLQEALHGLGMALALADQQEQERRTG